MWRPYVAYSRRRRQVEIGIRKRVPLGVYAFRFLRLEWQ